MKKGKGVECRIIYREAFSVIILKKIKIKNFPRYERNMTLDEYVCLLKENNFVIPAVYDSTFKYIFENKNPFSDKLISYVNMLDIEIDKKDDEFFIKCYVNL